MGRIKFLVMSILVVFIAYGCAQHPITISGKTTGTIKVTGANDALEDMVRVSSYEYVIPATSLGGLHLDGKIPINTAHYYFMGDINKKTGLKSYRLYTSINSAVDGRDNIVHWDEIRFTVNGQLTKIPASYIKSDFGTTAGGITRGQNFNIEDSVVSLDRETLGYWAKSETLTQVRYASSKRSGNFDVMIDPKHVAAFLERMDKGK